VDEAKIDKKTAHTVGAFHHALMIGVMTQLLIDRKQAPSARDLTEALQSLKPKMKPRAKERTSKQRR